MVCTFFTSHTKPTTERANTARAASTPEVNWKPAWNAVIQRPTSVISGCDEPSPVADTHSVESDLSALRFRVEATEANRSSKRQPFGYLAVGEQHPACRCSRTAVRRFDPQSPCQTAVWCRSCSLASPTEQGVAFPPLGAARTFSSANERRTLCPE